MEHRPSLLLRIAAPLKSSAQRFMYLGLILVSFFLIIIGKIDAVIMDRMRASVVELSAPILLALAHPVSTISSGISNLRDLSYIRQENARLTIENKNLMQWHQLARRLQSENTALQALLNSVSELKPRYITTRIISNSMGALTNIFVVNAGMEQGVKKGHAVLGEKGLVGRVVSVSKNTARVLLITDIDSRVPIIIETSRIRAVMAGANGDRPRLIHLPPGARIMSSERVVTSGHGGVFPPGLAVGMVSSVSDKGIFVKPFTSYHQLEFVRIVDYGVKGISVSGQGVSTGGGALENR